MINKIHNIDFREGFKNIEPGSVDLILTDPPYGLMNGFNGIEWDEAINPSEIHKTSNILLRRNGRLVLFSQEPYTHQLIRNQLANLPFNYKMVWLKDTFGNGLSAKHAPVSFIEDIVVFTNEYETTGEHPLRGYFKRVFYYIGTSRREIIRRIGHTADHTFRYSSAQFAVCSEETYNDLIKEFCINKMVGFKEYKEIYEVDLKYKEGTKTVFNLWEGKKHKPNVFRYSRDKGGYHPTQKPVALLEDLIKTYTNEGDTVVDLTIGSGSTAIAAINTGRNFIGFEIDEDYYNIAKERANKALLSNK